MALQGVKANHFGSASSPRRIAARRVVVGAAARLALPGVSGSYVGGEPVAEDGEAGQAASRVPLGLVVA
jgi:hypothetical protein